MAKDEFWNADPVEPKDTASDGGAFWLSDPDPARQELPPGVKPSQAGGGRGNLSLADYQRPAPEPKPRARWEDHADQMMADTAAPPAKSLSVLQSQPWPAPAPERRLSMGAGPINQQTAAAAESLVDGQATAEQAANPVVRRAAAGLQRQVNAGQRDTFGRLVDRAQQPATKKLATKRQADEWRSVGEVANDTAAALLSGVVSVVQLPVNIIAPGSALHESLQKSLQNLQDFESEPMKARRQQLADRVNNEEGFINKYAATVSELVSNPSVAIHETIRLAAMFASVLAAIRVGSAVAQGGVLLAGRVSPIVALGEAISGGAIASRAAGLGATAGGVGASSTMAAGDAAGNAYDKLMNSPQSMWDQSEDYRALIAKGMSPQEAKQEIATAKARTAAMIAAPLGLLGFMGAEASFVARGAGRAASGRPLRTVATELVTEPTEEALTQVAGNYAAQTVNPEQSLGEGAGEAAGMATVTSGPFAAAAAINEMRRPVDRTEQIKALRASGDTTAADMLKRRFDREMAVFNAGSESQRLAQFGSAAQETYRQIRMTGVKIGDAVTQAAIRTGYEQASQMAGLSPKAKTALEATLQKTPPEKAPAVVQKYITALAQTGAAQPFEGLDTLADSIEAQMDGMLDAVIAGDIRPTMNAIQELENQSEATQAAATDEQASAAIVDAVPAEAIPDGEGAVSGVDQQELETALTDTNDVLVTPEIDAVDAGTDVQNAPQGTARAEAQAPAVEAPEAARGDDAADGGVPAAPAGTGDDEASPELQAEVAALSAQMEAIGRDPVDIMERLALQYPDDTRKQFHERAKAALTQAVAEATQPTSGGNSGQDGGQAQQSDTADYGPATQAHRDATDRFVKSFGQRLSGSGPDSNLLDAVAPRRDTKRGRAAASVATIAKRLFNREVVFVKFNGPAKFNGAVSRAIPGFIFLNIDSQKPLMAVLGHELLHEMAKNQPALYADLSSRLDNLIKGETEYGKRLVAQYQKQGINTKGLDAREELEADIVGDNFMDADFWRAMGENQPGLFRRIVGFITRWLDGLSQKIAGYRPFGTDQFLTDIAAARAAVADAMRQFSGAEVGAVTDGADADAQLSIAAKAPAQSPATSPVTPTQQPLQLPVQQQPTSAPLPADTMVRQVQRWIQDQFNRFTVIRNWAKEQGMNLSQLSDVWGFEERMHGRIATRIEDFREKRVQPLVQRIQKAGFTMEQVAEFLHAQHAEERNNQILSIDPNNPMGSGMDTADAKVILAGAAPELVKLANEFRSITEDTKNILLRGGIISQEMVNAWEKAYKHYVPLKGGDEQVTPQGTGKGLSVKATNKRAMGHSARQEFIIENIMRDYERAVMLVEKNRVGHSLLAMTIELGREDIATFGQPVRRKVLKNSTEYEVVGKNGAVVGTFDSQQAANAFIVTQTRAGLTVRAVKGDPMVTFMASPMLAENEVQIYVKGQTVRIQLNDPLLARAYKKLGVESLTKMMQVNREINGFLSKAYTAYNPEFFIKNVLRDFTTGIINITGQEGALLAARAAARYPIAFGQMLRYSFSKGNKASNSIKLYRAHGGTTGAAYLSDIERVGADIQAAYEEYQGVARLAATGRPVKAANVAARKLVKAIVGWMEHLNAAGENAMRLAVFDALRTTPGRTIQEAASLAKNSTVNFNRKGEIGAQANALYLFFNAAMQGSAATLDAMFMGKHKYQAQAVAAALGGLAYSVAALQFGGDDEEDRKAWDKIPDHVKDRNLIIRTGEDTYITLAIPYGYGFFFSAGNAVFDLQRGEDKDKVALKLTSGLLEHFGPAINPLGGDELDSRGLVELMPGAFGGELNRAAARLLVNRSGLGGEIVPDSPFDDGKPDSQRMFRTTKGTGYESVAATLNQISGGTKSQAGFIDISPETVKFWTQTITGGAGKFVVDTTTAASLMASRLGEDDPMLRDALTPEIRELPLTRTLVRKEDIRDARRLYWEKVKEAQQAQQAFKRAEKMADDKGMLNVIEQQSYLLGMGKTIEANTKAIAALRDAIDVVNASEDYTKAEKRLIIKDLERGERELYEAAIVMFSQMKPAR